MDERRLQDLIAEGLSLEQIGRRVGRAPSTVAYWLDRHGLQAVHRERHAARGPLAREVLADLVARDHTVAELAAMLDRSPTTVRYWLGFHGLQTTRAARRRARPDGAQTAREEDRPCERHGVTRHLLRSDRWRCARCASEAVTERRRTVKRLLVDEAGGRCAICGYDRCMAALQFHHLDPAQKRFGLGLKGLARAVDTLREEARKCVLLCANCHAEVEAGVTDLATDAPFGGNSIGRMLGC